jgi:glycogen synthase
MRKHADEAPDLYEQLLAVESLVYEQADGFMACGQAIVEEVEAAYGLAIPQSRLGIVVHGMADEAGGHQPASHETAPRILFVGRLEARKGIDTLLESAVALADSEASFELRIVGDDSLVGPSGRTYRADFERLHPELAGMVQFLGRVDDDALRHEYRTCDVFVAPSRFESFGLILLEAMMFAKPVVSSSIGLMTEVVRDGESGLLVPPGDAMALTEALRRLISSPELRASLGRGGRAAYEASFTLDRMAREAEQFYESLTPVPSAT